MNVESGATREKIKKAKIKGHQGRRDFNVGRDSFQCWLSRLIVGDTWLPTVEWFG